MLVQIEQPDSETALYSIVWMYHNWTPVEGYLSCSFRLFLKFYYTQLCCNEYPLCTSLIVEWMLRSPIGSEAICICNFDSCWQIVLHRGYTNLYSNSNVWEKFFAHSLMTQCYLNFLIIANLKDAVFHFGAILICIYLTWVSLTIVQVLKVYAYTFFLWIICSYYLPIRKSKHCVCRYVASVVFPRCCLSLLMEIFALQGFKISMQSV